MVAIKQKKLVDELTENVSGVVNNTVITNEIFSEYAKYHSILAMTNCQINEPLELGNLINSLMIENCTFDNEILKNGLDYLKITDGRVRVRNLDKKISFSLHINNDKIYVYNLDEMDDDEKENVKLFVGNREYESL